MMGKQTEQKELFSYSVDLDRRVRADHPLRKVRETIDFEFVREDVAQFYGYNGNVSVDPVVILKLMFLLFWDDVKSERALMNMLPERLDYLWFLGYGLDDDVPDHSVLSKARKRWGVETFEALFVRTVQQCVEHQLVEGSKIHMDSSLIDANAAKDRVFKASPELIASLREISKAQAAKLEDTQVTAAEPANDTHFCETDPDATLVRRPGKPSHPRYHSHRAVDDRVGVVTVVKTTTGSIAEDRQMGALIDQHEANTDRQVDATVADSKYGTTTNYIDCEKRGIRSHFNSLSAAGSNKGRRAGIFGDESFSYDSATDTYMCPAGQTLKPRRFSKLRRTLEYIAPKGACDACHLRAQCTRAKTGRTVRRHPEQDTLDQARAHVRSLEARRDLVRRQYLIEGSFGDAANNHHFKRSRWRRIWRQRIQDYLIAAVQNIKKLIRYGRTPERRPAAGAIEGIVAVQSENFVCRGFQKVILSMLTEPVRVSIGVRQTRVQLQPTID